MNKSIRIFIVGAHHSYNKGWSAIVKCTIHDIKRHIPQANFSVESMTVDRDKNWYKGTRVVPMYSLGTYVHEHRKADVILYVGGDILSVSQATQLFKRSKIVLSILIHLLRFLYWGALRKKVVIYAHSLGPYRSFLWRCVAKFILARAKLITVRGEISAKYLEELGIRNYYVTADPAFLLTDIKEDKVREILSREKVEVPPKRPMIGISVSRNLSLHKRGYDTILHIFAKALEEVIEKFAGDVILIPYSGGRNPNEDDKLVSNDLLNYVAPKYRSRIKMLKGDYSSEELRGIIALCKFFVGCRMHANIAALSTCTPVIAISHGHKYPEIMKMFGMEEFVCDVRELTLDEFLSKMEKLWEEKEDIKQRLKERIEKVRRLAKLNAILVKRMLAD